ncbi:MAG: DUF1934 domain-containing protein [Clostridia bacterium]|nr:DUF1934 domain-containing protein [Clostridia bacterium]
MDVTIQVTGTQQVDGESDTVELITDGTMTKTAEETTLCYNETEATGMAGTVTTLHIQPSKVTLERRGANAGLLVLEHNKRHSCSYMTPVGQMMLGVFTDQMQQNLTEGLGTLSLSYTLDVGGRVLSRQLLKIKVSER